MVDHEFELVAPGRTFVELAEERRLQWIRIKEILRTVGWGLTLGVALGAWRLWG